MHGNVHGEHSKDEAKRNMLDRVKTSQRRLEAMRSNSIPLRQQQRRLRKAIEGSVSLAVTTMI
jgi:hypothetical protein